MVKDEGVEDGASLDRFSAVPGQNDPPTSPNDCLRGFSSGDLMAIADDGEVFQHFVRSLSGSDQSTATASPATPVASGCTGGAVPKKEALRPRRSPCAASSSSPSLRVMSREGDAERWMGDRFHCARRFATLQSHPTSSFVVFLGRSGSISKIPDARASTGDTCFAGDWPERKKGDGGRQRCGSRALCGYNNCRVTVRLRPPKVRSQSSSLSGKFLDRPKEEDFDGGPTDDDMTVGIVFKVDPPKGRCTKNPA